MNQGWRRSRWGRYIEPLLGWVVEGVCPLCDRPTPQEFCRDCLQQVQACALTGRSRLWQAEDLSGFAWGRYGGSLKRAIAALKYNSQPALARPLGHWLGQAWLATPQMPHNTQVMAIPMHPAKQKERGFNQAELIAEAFCQVTRLPLERRGLIRVRATAAQFGLSATARTENLNGAIQVHPALQRRKHPPGSMRPVILLDDIYTTGATVQTAAQALKQQGIPVWGVVAIARAISDQPANLA